MLGLVGGAPGGGHRASPIHRRRARAASFITAYLLLSRTASANPPEQCATFARSINLSRDFPQATLDRGDAFGTVHSNKASRHSARPLSHRDFRLVPYLLLASKQLSHRCRLARTSSGHCTLFVVAFSRTSAESYRDAFAFLPRPPPAPRMAAMVDDAPAAAPPAYDDLGLGDDDDDEDLERLGLRDAAPAPAARRPATARRRRTT